MRWKPIIILSVLLFMIMLIIFVIYKYPRTVSSNKNIITSQYLKNKNIQLNSKYYENKSISPEKSLFFIYNPSIQWNKDGNITTIARVSGMKIPKMKNCLYNHFKKTKTMD